MVLLNGQHRATFRGDFVNDSVHIPVLADEVAALLGGSGGNQRPDGWIVDATLGAGGHSAALLERFPGVRVLGTDQDPEILDVARERLEPFQDRVRLERSRISDLSRLLRKLRLERPCGFLMDLGVSSLQLDSPERGFSFQVDGPLDMRMDPGRERSAADIVNTWDEGDLADLFYHEGGEGRSRRIAAEIVRYRRRVAFKRTGALADLVAHVYGRSGGRTHPATKVFQALRRAVNHEGEELLAGLKAAEWWLADGGVLAVIAFHSGEDAVLKRFLKQGEASGNWEILTRKPVRAAHAEARRNPRARSAVLRGAVRRRAPQTELPSANTLAEGRREEEVEGGGRS
jgi:16S rRNA (cytosine1402-N4)-methyltransferase